MPENDVARAMGAPTAVVGSESTGVARRVLRYASEPVPIKVTLSDGKVSAVALDIVGIENPSLPAHGRRIWSGMHRTEVLRIMGAPVEDRLHDSFGIKLEHMIFERAGLPDLSVFLADERGALLRYHYPLNRLPASRLLLPRSGLARSDFVLWPQAAVESPC